jgi:H+/Cl- antiporter ClcA
LAAVLGAVISAGAYWYLKLVTDLQGWVFTDLPHGLGFTTAPSWWPLLPMATAGVVVGAAIRYLPGRGGHSPADGLKVGGVTPPNQLPGVFLTALAGLGLGAVIGPEAPLIALGGGLAVMAVQLAKRETGGNRGAVIAATGSFAAISTLLGNPLSGAVLMLEASGLGGPTATVVLIPGLLGAGIGSLIFLGLNGLTGYGTFSLAIPNLPPTPHLQIAQFGWALAIGAAAALVSSAIKRLALLLRPYVERRLTVLTLVAGLVIGGLAIAYNVETGKPSSDVLFSGQSALPLLVEGAARYTVGTLSLLVACKGIAYSLSLAAFRGGPTFPAMFLGAAGGVALSHIPGLPLVPGIAIGIAAMTAAMLQLPITAVLLTTLFLGTDGITVMPLVIVAVVVAFVLMKWLNKGPQTGQTGARPA